MSAAGRGGGFGEGRRAKPQGPQGSPWAEELMRGRLVRQVRAKYGEQGARRPVLSAAPCVGPLLLPFSAPRGTVTGRSAPIWLGLASCVGLTSPLSWVPQLCTRSHSGGCWSGVLVPVWQLQGLMRGQ